MQLTWFLKPTQYAQNDPSHVMACVKRHDPSHVMAFHTCLDCVFVRRVVLRFDRRSAATIEAQDGIGQCHCIDTRLGG